MMTLGRRFGKPALNVGDNGAALGLRGTLPYDDEGTPTQDTPLIREGVLVVAARLFVCRAAGRRAHVADLQLRDVGGRIPVERDVDDRVVPSIGPVDRVEHQRAVFGRAAHRADRVLRPRERHSAVAAHAAERRANTADAVSRGRLDDRSTGVAADREADEAGRRRRARTR